MASIETRAPLNERLRALAECFAARAYEPEVEAVQHAQFLLDHAASLMEFARQGG